MLYNAPISAGDLIDRISILQIKCNKLPEEKAEIAAKELKLLQECSNGLTKDPAIWELYCDLRDINELLWDVENAVRVYHAAKNYGVGFVQEARKIAPYNDQRAKIKLEINKAVGSTIVEMKSHF